MPFTGAFAADGPLGTGTAEVVSRRANADESRLLPGRARVGAPRLSLAVDMSGTGQETDRVEVCDGSSTRLSVVAGVVVVTGTIVVIVLLPSDENEDEDGASLSSVEAETEHTDDLGRGATVKLVSLEIKLLVGFVTSLDVGSIEAGGEERKKLSCAPAMLSAAESDMMTLEDKVEPSARMFSSCSVDCVMTSSEVTSSKWVSSSALLLAFRTSSPDSSRMISGEVDSSACCPLSSTTAPISCSVALEVMSSGTEASTFDELSVMAVVVMTSFSLLTTSSVE